MSVTVVYNHLMNVLQMNYEDDTYTSSDADILLYKFFCACVCSEEKKICVFVTTAIGIGIVFLCSLATAIWTVVVGENTKGIHERIIHVLLCTAVCCVNDQTSS